MSKHTVYLLTVVLLLFTGIVRGQGFEKVFTYNNVRSCFLSAVCLKEGGYLFAGEENNGYYSRVILTKTDDAGSVIWSKIFSPEKGTHNISAYSVIQTTDGGFAFSGSYHGDSAANLFIVKLNATADVEWDRVLYTKIVTEGRSMVQTHDGGFVVTGKEWPTIGNSSITPVIKFDSKGNIEWRIAIGNPDQKATSFGMSVRELSDFSLVIGGSTDLPGGSAFNVMRLSSDGNILWKRRLGRFSESLNGMTITHDDNILVCGLTSTVTGDKPFSENTDIYIQKITKNGELLWSKKIDAFKMEQGYDIAELRDHSIIISGMTSSGSTDADSLLVTHLSENGGLRSIKMLATSIQKVYGWTVQATPDTAYIIAGGIWDDEYKLLKPFMLKSDTSLSFCNERSIIVSVSDAGSVFDSAYTVIEGSKSAVEMAVSSTAFNTTEQILCKLSVPKIFPSDQLSLNPNPINSHQILKISLSEPIIPNLYILSLRDALGKQVHHETRYLGGEEEIAVSVTDLPSGIYTVELLDANSFASVWRGKVVKTR